ncbi:MATE family efflux transporter [Neiella marina]|uniref:MATE family efflux transporter n=1 Tax=Neiella holothuriorum TaxID=2870530 RepID=A0ABS7EKH9_9GAMM|nr:MATE family efflux transporter [Neiella holothuriorum]MBW8192858.1 MATE family efflux transporter [Neiella holothuriorum]
MQQPSSFRTSFSLAWPISLQQVLMTVLGMVDVMMVGHLGNAAVAAVGLGNRVHFVILVIFAGLGTALSILVAQYWGAKNIRGVRNSVLLATVTGITLLAPVVVWLAFAAEQVIGWGTTDPQVIELGAHYIRLTLVALICSLVLVILEAAMRSVGEVKTPLAISAGAVSINIALNAILIFGWGSIPAMGVAGAAIATSIARTIHVLALLGFMLWRRHNTLPRLDNLPVLQSVIAWRRYLTMSLPMMLNFGIWSSGTFVYIMLYGRVSTDALAIASLLTPIEGMLLSLFFGMAAASAIMVGQRLGANDHQQAWVLARNFALYNPLFALLVGLVLALNYKLILAPYHDLGQQTLEQAAQLLLVIGSLGWLKVTNMTLSMGVLRTGGENRYCLLADTFGMWCIGIPMTWLAVQMQWPFLWVYLMVYTEEVTKAILFIRKLASRSWMHTIATTEH